MLNLSILLQDKVIQMLFDDIMFCLYLMDAQLHRKIIYLDHSAVECKGVVCVASQYHVEVSKSNPT